MHLSVVRSGAEVSWKKADQTFYHIERIKLARWQHGGVVDTLCQQLAFFGSPYHQQGVTKHRGRTVEKSGGEYELGFTRLQLGEQGVQVGRAKYRQRRGIDVQAFTEPSRARGITRRDRRTQSRMQRIVFTRIWRASVDQATQSRFKFRPRIASAER